MTTTYAAPRGLRYHSTPACVGLNGYATATCDWTGTNVPVVTRAQIAARGLIPCGVCKPAPILSVVR